MPDEPAKVPQPAMRLIFEYDGDQVRLVSQTPVTMVVHESDPGQTFPGLYVDSRNASNEAVARVPAHSALLESAEIFPSGPDERLHRVDRSRSGAFTVVVPAPEEAHHVTVVQVAHGEIGPRGIATREIIAHDGGRAMATDLAEFPIRRG
jgi:hypothetical protein